MSATVATSRHDPALGFHRQHLLGCEDLRPWEIEALLERADAFADGAQSPDLLRGQTLINLFFEDSTRTRTAFEVAARRLGADVVNMQVASSSVNKGESLLDTAATLNALDPAFLVVRHPESGAPALLASKVQAAVVNGGDGTHEHPTQALLDALTLRRHFGQLEGLTVAICGDIAHSRVARSNLFLLTQMGVKVRLIGPPGLVPAAFEALGAEIHFRRDSGLKGVDAVMVLRLQRERMAGSQQITAGEFFRFYGLDAAALALAAEQAVILHPGPMNRGVEIASSLADDPTRSLIATQVRLGVAVRQACFAALQAARISRSDGLELES